MDRLILLVPTGGALRGAVAEVFAEPVLRARMADLLDLGVDACPFLGSARPGVDPPNDVHPPAIGPVVVPGGGELVLAVKGRVHPSGLVVSPGDESGVGRRHLGHQAAAQRSRAPSRPAMPPGGPARGDGPARECSTARGWGARASRRRPKPERPPGRAETGLHHAGPGSAATALAPRRAWPSACGSGSPGCRETSTPRPADRRPRPAGPPGCTRSEQVEHGRSFVRREGRQRVFQDRDGRVGLAPLQERPGAAQRVGRVGPCRDGGKRTDEQQRNQRGRRQRPMHDHPCPALSRVGPDDGGPRREEIEAKRIRSDQPANLVPEVSSSRRELPLPRRGGLTPESGVGEIPQPR